MQAILLSARCVFVLVLVLVLALVGCSTPSRTQHVATDPPKSGTPSVSVASRLQDPTNDPVSPGDWIMISQTFDKALTGKFQVQFDGTVQLPYDKTLLIQGLSLDELRALLQRTYQSYYQTPLTLEVSLGERKRWIEIGGLVNHPTRILVRKDEALDQIISAAGGLHSDASAKFAKIESENQTQLVNLEDYFDRGDDTGIPDWHGGEKITLLRESPEPPIHLLGEVRRPGDIPYKSGADFLYYLNKALGPTQFADLKQIQLIKNQGSDSQSIRFEATDHPNSQIIEKGDILLVPADKPGIFDRVIQILAGIGGLSATVAALILIL